MGEQLKLPRNGGERPLIPFIPSSRFCFDQTRDGWRLEPVRVGWAGPCARCVSRVASCGAFEDLCGVSR